VWLGRSLLGQWAWDVLQWIEVVSSLTKNPPRGLATAAPGAPIVLESTGAIGVVALLASAFDARVQLTCVEKGLVSYVSSTEGPWSGIPMGLAAPKLLRFGDVGTLAALSAPRRLVVIGGVETTGETASGDRLKEAFSFTRSIYDVLTAGEAFEIAPSREASKLMPRV
jgi:hypothetical protein